MHRQQRRCDRLEQIGTQLTAPLEQHIGVDAILLRQLRHRDTRCTSLDGETPFEVSRIVGAALAVACRFICIQSDSHQKSDGNYFGVCGLLKIDGGGKTLTINEWAGVEVVRFAPYDLAKAEEGAA